MAVLRVATSATFSAGDLIWIVALAPEPTACTAVGFLPGRAFAYASSTALVEIVWLDSETDGIEIFVPPLKSMPRLKPLNTIEPMQTSRMMLEVMYQRTRLPTMSKAPLPT